MSTNSQPSERPQTPSAVGLMVLVSLLIHVVLVISVAVFAKPGEGASSEREFAISLQHPPIERSNLPPLEGSREAGPLQGIQPQANQIVEQEIEEPKPEPVDEKREEPKKEPEKKAPEPSKAERESRPAKESPARDSSVEVISARGSTDEPKEKEEPKPVTPNQLRENLQGRDDVYSSSRDVAGGKVSQHMAMEGDSGGGVPDTIRKTLMALIWQQWEPPNLAVGQVKESVIEFTLFSPPLPEDAINKNRPRSRLTGIKLVKGSGDRQFDSACLEAIKRMGTLPLPPLPQYYKQSRLVVSCRFYYIGENN